MKNRLWMYWCFGIAVAAVSPLQVRAQGYDAVKVQVSVWGTARANEGSGEGFSADYYFNIPELSAGGSGTTETSGATFSASGATAKMVPGRSYIVTWGGNNLAESNVQASAPPGYAIEFSGVESSSYGGPSTIRLIPKYASFTGRAGTTSSLSTGKVHWQVALGYLANGDPARSLAIMDEATTSSWSDLFTPRGLSVQSSEVGVIYTPTDSGPFLAGELRQVICNEAYVDIVPAAGRTSYDIKFYSRDTAGASQSASGQPFTFTGTPFVTYTIARDGGDTKLKITREDRKADGTTARTFVTSLERTGSSISDFVWKMEDWHLSGQDAQVVESTAWTSNATGRLETITKKNAANTVASIVAKQYQTFSWGEELVSTTRGTSNQVIETLTYHTGDTGPAFLRAKLTNGGAWEAYHYSGIVGGRLLRTFRPYNGSPTSPPASNLAAASWDGSVGEVTTLTYATGEFDRVATSTTTVNGVQTAKSSTVYLDPSTGQTANGERYVVATRTDWVSNDSAVSKLITYTKFYREDAANLLLRNQIHSVQKPDGTKLSFAYQNGTFSGSAFSATSSGGTASRTAVIRGTVQATGSESPAYSSFSLPGDATTYSLDSIYLVAGKSSAEVTIRDASARVRRTESYVRSGGTWVLLTSVDFAYDYANRLIGRTVNNGASYAAYTASYQNASNVDTGVLQWEQDEFGIKTEFTYDNAGRVLTATKKGVGVIGDLTTTYSYDADGHVLTQVVGPTTGEKLTTTRAYDDAGRLSSEAPPGLGATTYAYSPTTRTQTVTYPSTATRIESFDIDGRLASVTGTAVVHEYYTYSVLSPNGERKVRVDYGSSGNSRKTETTKDQLGRTISVLHPGFTGQADHIETFIYDGLIGSTASGQLSKVTRTGYAPTLYEYDTFGRVKRTGQRISGATGALVENSEDRIVDLTESFENYSSAWWHTNTKSTYFVANNTTSKLVERTRIRLNGFSGNLRSEVRTRDAELEAEDKDVIRTVSVVPTTKTVTTSTQRPGTEFSESTTSVNGLPTSTTGHDNVTSSTTYDSLHRVSTRVDPRTGTTTTAYYTNTSLVSSVEDATKTASQAGNLTYYGYDTSGRVTSVTDPAGKISRKSYNLRGQVLQQWGHAANPLENGYDNLGQRTTLTTYQSGANWSNTTWPGGTSTSITTWVYDPPSGLLSAKKDADNQSFDYSYNSRRQVSERKSPRKNASNARITTTYGYDANTGELLTITYNDGTPALTHTYTRAGQLESVAQATAQGGAGTLDLVYDPSAPWRLATKDWGDYYGDRLVTQLYESASAVGSENGFYTHKPATVRGRYYGFQIGITGNLARDRQETLTYSNHGRIAGVSSRPGSSASRDFVYSYAANSSLVSGYTAGSFTQSIVYESHRDLPTQVKTTWSAPALATIAQFDYLYNGRGERESAKQSGTAFADFGPSTYYRYAYTARGEVQSAANYLGDDQTVISSPQLSGRHFAYTYDHAGNRLTASRTGTAGAPDDYFPNKHDQYDSKENNAYTVGGTANDQAVVTVTGASQPVAVGRQGKFWGAQALLPNGGTQPGKASLSVTATVGANSQNQLRTAYLAAGLQSFVHNEDGTLKTDGVWNYSWDAENRLIQMTTTGVAVTAGFPNRTVEFKYDFLGRRIQKRSLNVGSGPDTYRRYLYDGWNLVAEFDATATSCGALLRSFTWGLDITGSLGASGGVGALLQITDHATGAVYLPARDANGNIAALINTGTNTVAASYEYSPFGELLRVEGAYAAANPFRFSSKFTDDETGLLYYGLRYYNPALGRFVNRDPIGDTGGSNLYRFCGNDAINSWDYLGLAEATQGKSEEPTSSGTWDNIINLGNIDSGFYSSGPSKPLPDNKTEQARDLLNARLVLEVTVTKRKTYADWERNGTNIGYTILDLPGTHGGGDVTLYWFNRLRELFPDPDLEDDFDRRFAHEIGVQATDVHRWGHLTGSELEEAVARGYLSIWDLPIGWFDGTQFGAGGTRAFGGPSVREIAWLVGTGVVAELAPGTIVMIRMAAARMAAGSAQTVAMEIRVGQIHRALDPIAQEMRTTAIVRTSDGTQIVGGGARDLTRAQISVLQESEVAAKLPGAHAEMTVLNSAHQAGLRPAEIVVTRPICPDCQIVIEVLGGRVTSPTRAVFRVK